MKTLRLCSLAVILLLLAPAAVPQRPHPPGLDDPSKNVPPLEAPMNKIPVATVAQLHHDAEELLQLSQSVSAGIDQTGKGVLPKDLPEKLKRIEKLSKKLRNELAL